MGTYGVSRSALIGELVSCLDDVEGDFDRKTLWEALEFMKSYCPTSDSTEAQENKWNKDLEFVFSEVGE